MKKYSKKGLERRKAERECLPDFFQKHIEIAKTKCCEECGAKLKGDVSEVAHILPKQYFKSVMCSDENVTDLWAIRNDVWKSYKNQSTQNDLLSGNFKISNHSFVSINRISILCCDEHCCALLFLIWFFRS